MKHASLPRVKLAKTAKPLWKCMDFLEFEKTAIHMLADILRAVPFLNVRKPLGPHRSPGEMFPNDGAVRVEYKVGEQWRGRYLTVEVRQSAQMRELRFAIDRIEHFVHVLHTSEPGYGVFASQYLPQAAKDYCKEKGVGYFDLSGNCYISFDNVYIEKDVPLTVAPEKKRLRSLFSDKSARVIRRILAIPERDWRVQQLALHAQVSKATASLLKDKLVEGGYAIENEDSSFKIKKPEELLRDWARHYKSLRSSQLECFARGDLVENEAHFSQFCNNEGLRYAYTMFSAARRVAPFVRGVNRSHVYVESLNTLHELAAILGFKPVDSGGNFLMIAPSDDDVFYDSYNLDNELIVSDIQLYLDLAGHKGRGEENAEFVLDERIRKRWQSSTT